MEIGDRVIVSAQVIKRPLSQRHGELAIILWEPDSSFPRLFIIKLDDGEFVEAQPYLVKDERN